MLTYPNVFIAKWERLMGNGQRGMRVLSFERQETQAEAALEWSLAL